MQKFRKPFILLRALPSIIKLSALGMFESKCACDKHEQLPNCLVFTSFFLYIPSVMFSIKGYNILLFLCAMQGTISILYHVSHTKFMKICDLIILLILTTLGSLHCLTICSFQSIVALILLFYCMFLGYHPSYREDGKIKLQFHACIHIIGSCALSLWCIAVE